MSAKSRFARSRSQERRLRVQQRFYLLDGHSQIYRAIHSPGPPLTAPSGEPTKGTYIFTRMLLKLIREQRPNFLAMASDGPSSKEYRRKLFPAYKSNRPTNADPDLYVQVDRCQQIVRTAGIPVIEHPGYEADDVIATLVSCVLEACDTIDVVIVSRDKDLHQLVGPRVTLYDPMSEDRVGEQQVLDKWGVRPDQMAQLQALAGDPTDGIPGVRGIGPKKARQLLTTYGTIEGVLRALHELPQATRACLLEADLELCCKLTTLVTDLELEFDASALRFDGVHYKQLKPLLRSLGFRRWSA